MHNVKKNFLQSISATYSTYICDFLGTTAVCSGSNKPALYGREGEGGDGSDAGGGHHREKGRADG